MENKTKLMKKLALILLLGIMLITPALATKGVGIAWDAESAILLEGKKSCLSYGVYNPFDEDVDITLSAKGLEELNPKSETKFVKAGTPHSSAETINICFKVPRLYENCEVPEKTITGEIVASEAPSSIKGVTGSATVAMASVPLSIKVSCNPSKLNQAILILLVAAIVIGAAVYYYKKK